MPVTIKDTDSGQGNIILCQGHFTGEEYLDALKVHLSQDAATFRRYRYSLFDISEITGLNFSNPELEEVVQLCLDATRINPDPFVAMVASKDLTFGLARMFETMLAQTDWETMVFRTRPDAEQWLREEVKKKFGLDALTFK